MVKKIAGNVDASPAATLDTLDIATPAPKYIQQEQKKWKNFKIHPETVVNITIE